MDASSNNGDLRNSPQPDPYTTDNLEPAEMDMDQSDLDGGQSPEAQGDTQEQQAQSSQNENNDINNLDHHHPSPKDEGKRKDNYDVEINERPKETKAPKTRLVQVINIAPAATTEQLRRLFGFLGDISNIAVYQTDTNSDSILKVCFVEFARHSSVLMAQHLTNTVFIDRALVVLPYYDKHEIPNRDEALASVMGSKLLTNFDFGFQTHLTTSQGGAQVISTTDPRLTALGVSQYPHLPINTDPTRVEEIRRTVYIGNLDSTIPPDEVMKFFNDIAEVKYIRMAGDETQPTRFAFVEYTHQSSIVNALQHNGTLLGGRTLKISHSNNAIVKPQPKLETDDMPKRYRDNRSSSREYGRDRHHTSRYDRDRERSKRNRHRNRRDRRKSRDRDPLPSRRSRSRDHISRRRSISRDRGSRRRDRSRSRDSKRRRSRSKSIERTRSRRRRSNRK